MRAYHIVGWERYEHPDVRRHEAFMPWVKTPTDHNGIGYLELIGHPDGLAHFGIWNLVLQLAANGVPRGFLATNGGRAMGAREISLKTRASEPVVAEAVKRLLAIGWVEHVRLPSASASRANRQRDASVPQVEKEREKEREGRAAPHPPDVQKVKNAKALKDLLRSMGELASSAEAVQDWAALMQGAAQCVTAAEALEGVDWLVHECRDQGIVVKYSRDVPAAVVARWAKILKNRDKLPEIIP